MATDKTPKQAADAAETTTAETPAVDGVQAIKDLKAELDKMSPAVMPDELKASILEQARSKQQASRVEGLIKDLTTIANHDKHSDVGFLLAGQKLIFTIVFPADAGDGEEEQAATTSHRILAVKTGEGGKPGGRTKVIVNGTEYPTAAAACEANKLDHKGTSAVRVLKKALEAKQIESLEFPTVEEAPEATPAAEGAEATTPAAEGTEPAATSGE